MYEEKIELLKREYHNVYVQQVESGELERNLAFKKKDGNCLPIHPTIPFVGKKFFIQKKRILLYASAENQTHYLSSSSLNPLYENDELAIMRTRKKFDETYNKFFFPDVSIAPITDGCLPIVIRYICEKLKIEMPDTPSEFYENISFANFGKYSFMKPNNPSANLDYAQDKSKLMVSEPYIKTDLEILQPDIIVMISTMYSDNTEKKFINEHIKDGTIIIPISQINASTINRTIRYRRRQKHTVENFPLKDRNQLSTVIDRWYCELLNPSRHYKNGISGKTAVNYLSVFSYLDSILKLGC